nr:hypothetical protein GCM10020092_015130 [Actinoplanes digitatis]
MAIQPALWFSGTTSSDCAPAATVTCREVVSQRSTCTARECTAGGTAAAPSRTSVADSTTNAVDGTVRSRCSPAASCTDSPTKSSHTFTGIGRLGADIPERAGHRCRVVHAVDLHGRPGTAGRGERRAVGRRLEQFAERLGTLTSAIPTGA